MLMIYLSLFLTSDLEFVSVQWLLFNRMEGQCPNINFKDQECDFEHPWVLESTEPCPCWLTH